MAKDSFTFPQDSHLHVTHYHIESWVHLKIQVTLNSNILQIQNKLNNIIKIVLYVSFDVDIGFHLYLDF